ncbi:5-formyltetrahydrofolate cyclo-ligase [Sanguibacter gelidistatuariae]|uniref:5-formyltetrahydrofolate cyclo-ligase n=1 Tax=Sanguibacter gelidistatuariae TaxID=1814289 RepID=A0A1G6Q3S3_9MICO|nr:5-formyltetrahydrofolate cyclo-ligase [Sanguibacter gelidistatuariae]SDC87112.1 5-formyltetrahydrofolate cyclo-ligase [Sanguibacter gelidistatuariae]
MSSPAQPYPVRPSLDAEDAKIALRGAIRAARETRSERRRDEAAKALAEILLTIPEVRDAQRVGLYAARPHEPGTSALMSMLDALGKQILLPVLGAGLQRDWALYAGEDDLLQRAPGRPPEPSTEALGPEALETADVVIAPALAVDTHGNRLGQGGGWYDRALAHVRPGVKVIAVVFPEEIYDAAERPLPREDHDRRVDGVATPLEWHWITG